MCLPVAHPDKLKAVVYCLEKEGLLFESVVTDIIVEAIDLSLSAGLSAESAAYSGRSIAESGSADAAKSRKSSISIISRASLSHSQPNTTATDNGHNNSRQKVKPFAPISQLMSNILDTFTAIIGDYLNVFPGEIDTLNIFKVKEGIVDY